MTDENNVVLSDIGKQTEKLKTQIFSNFDQILAISTAKLTAIWMISVICYQWDYWGNSCIAWAKSLIVWKNKCHLKSPPLAPWAPPPHLWQLRVLIFFSILLQHLPLAPQKQPNSIWDFYNGDPFYLLWWFFNWPFNWVLGFLLESKLGMLSLCRGTFEA